MAPDPALYKPGGSIVLRPRDPTWSTAFGDAAAELIARLGSVVVAVHHVGSTAIPGIAAKPVIDILAVVEDLGSLDERSDTLAELGYESLGEYGIPRRRYFRRNSGSGIRTHRVHAFPRGHEQIRRMLLFRDYLRAMVATAKQYEALKYQLAAQCVDNIDAYAGLKTDFVQTVLSLAETWAGQSRAPT